MVEEYVHHAFTEIWISQVVYRIGITFDNVIYYLLKEYVKVKLSPVALLAFHADNINCIFVLVVTYVVIISIASLFLS